MTVEGNTLVFAMLGAAFAGIGIHLFAWSRRRSGLLRQFAESRGLVYHAADGEGLERRVNDCVALEEPGMVRSFGQFSDVVAVGAGRLFRAVELLDLVPWGRAEYTNHARTAVTFPYPRDLEGIFLISPQLSVHQRYPASPSRTDEVKDLLARARIAAPPCTLSLTLGRGNAVAYLEPAMAGAVSSRHLQYLAELCERLASG